MNRHEVHVFENGTASIRDLEAGETMHSQVGPDAEAKKVYIEQSGLADRLVLPHEKGPLVLYDVGMGIASNAIAALELAESLPNSRPLHILSFENTLDGLELALKDPAHFATQDRHRNKLEALLKNRFWKSSEGKVIWELRFGNFLDQDLGQLMPLPPEVIFYDFYSPKSVPELWTSRCFERLFSVSKRRKALGQSTVLTTYSAATFVRSALLLAGFSVGYGAQTELKAETTIASTQLSELKNPLGKPWLDRLHRSSKPLPIDVAPSMTKDALAKIQASSQFSLS